MSASTPEPVADTQMRVALRIPSELVAWLDTIAAAEDRSRNYIIVRLLSQAKDSHSPTT